MRINGTDAFLNEPTCAKGDCEEKYVFPMVCWGTGKGPWELNRRGVKQWTSVGEYTN